MTEDSAEAGNFKPFSGHAKDIWAILYSPNSQSIATGSADCTVREWDAGSGRQVGATKKGHTDHVWALSYSPDGRFLASGSDDGTVRVWDTVSVENAAAYVLDHGRGVNCVAYSPDGELIASGGDDGKVKVWDARGRTLRDEFENGGLVLSVAWEPSGRRLAAGWNDKIHLFDVTKPGAPVLVIEKHQDTVRSVAYSPDGKWLASGSRDGSVRLWTAQTGTPAKSPFRGHKHWVRSVAWSPDSTRIISGALDHTVRVWDVSTGQPLFQGGFCAHSNDVRSVSYSPDSKSFVSVDAKSPPRIQVWDAWTGKPVLPPLSDGEYSALMRSAEETYTFDVENSASRKMRAGAIISAVAWFPNGRRFATAGAEPLVRIWSAVTGLQVGKFDNQRGTINALSISAEGSKLAAATSDHAILLVDAASMQLLMKPLVGHDSAISAVELTPDASAVVSGSKDGTVRIWSALTGEARHIIKEHISAVRALAITKDGSKVASGGDDNSVYVWNTQTYERLYGPLKHDDSVSALSFSPDGSRLVSGADDFAVRVWDLTTDKLAFDPIRIHTGPIAAVNWSQDGAKLVSIGAHDCTIWVWDASTGERILGPLEHWEVSYRAPNQGIGAAALAPDGKHLVSGSIDHTLQMWDIDAGAKVSLPRNDTNEEAESGSSRSASVSQESKPEERNASKSEERNISKSNNSPGEDNDGRSRSPDHQQQAVSTVSRQAQMRRRSVDEDSLESFMNMPAAREHRQAARNQKDFFDDIGDDDPPCIQETVEVVEEIQAKVEKTPHESKAFTRIVKQFSIKPFSKVSLKLKRKNKEETNTRNNTEEHTMTRMSRRVTKTISAAHDRVIIAAAGDDPRARFRREGEPELDVDDDSPTGSTTQNENDEWSSDDERERGLLYILCFCPCLSRRK